MKNNTNLINKELKVLNIGLSSFAENLKKENTKVVSVQWRPPAGGNKKMLDLLERYNKLRK
ncbi:MAG: fdrA domain protein [Armatimonadota bacterium]